MPRLLALQSHPSDRESQIWGELLLITVYQWYELWFTVLLTDWRAVRADQGATFESVKLLRRGIELFKLFDLHADVTESIVVRELGLTKNLRAPRKNFFSDQLSQIATPSLRLRKSDDPALVDAAREYSARLK